MRYFRFFSKWWKYNRVEGFKTIADRKTRARRMKRVHKPMMIRSAGRRLGARLRPRLQDQQLMADQHGFGHHTPETARLCQPNQRDDRMN
jgi:hypothetical protein